MRQLTYCRIVFYKIYALYRNITGTVILFRIPDDIWTKKDSHIHLHRSFASAAYRRSTRNWGNTKISAPVSDIPEQIHHTGQFSVTLEDSFVI